MTTIVIEGKGSVKSKKSQEEVFLRAIIRTITDINDNDIDFLPSAGWNNLSKLEPLLKEKQDFGNTILIIFDADNTDNNGGEEIRRNEIIKILKTLSVEAQIFLFPNNKDNGDFEILLEKIINPNHKVILDCFEKYVNCLKQYKFNGDFKYKMPNQKAKIYSYIDSFKKSRKQEEEMKNQNQWDFDNPEYWDLDNEYLTPLKQFLKLNLK